MPHDLAHYLNDDAAAGRVMARARLLLALSRRFEAAAPAGLANAARVANYKSGKVVIHADNGAVAAKIRQMGGRLGTEFSREVGECSGIEVKVQPRQIPAQSTGSHLKPLSAAACGSLRDMATRLPPGSLRTALDTLLARALRQE